MKQCSRCLLPETQETITYDGEGVCNVCRQNEIKKEKIDWAKKKEELREIIEQYRGKGEYDCLVPFSGGKDSTYTLYYLIKEFNLKPLAVCFDHGFFRPQVLKDRKKVFDKLGCDFVSFSPNMKVVRKLMLESLRRKGDFCWHCHTGVFSYPMQIAIKYNIPLIIWGEPSAEYVAYYRYDEEESVDERRFNRFVNLGITAEDMVGFIDDGTVSERDLGPYTYPKLKDLKKLGYRSFCLGSYIPWDPKRHAEISKKELGWQGNVVEGIPNSHWYEKVECYFTGVRDYLKFLKRGFGRTAHLMSLDIRNKRITTEEARKVIEENDGKRPKTLDIFLDFLGITEEEFMEIALSHVVAPHKYDKSEIKDGDKLPDHDDWPLK